MGVGPYGYGTPATATEPGGGVYVDALGIIQGSRKLKFAENSVTSPFRTGAKYEYDDYGRAVGSPDVTHLVTVAVLMRKGSSAAKDIGNRLTDVRYVTPNIQKEFEALVNEMFASLIEQGFIRVENVTVDPRNGMPTFVHILIRDLTTNTLMDELSLALIT